MKHILVLSQGYLCIRAIDCDYSEPFWMVRDYPCFKCTEYDAKGYDFPIGQEMDSDGTGTYICRDRNLDRRRFELASMGATKPIAFDRVPMDNPICKQQVRYQWGKWQKLLKSGWRDLYPPMPVTFNPQPVSA